MPGRRRSRLAALVAVLALVIAVPFERDRGCSVCPVDCPMHAAKRPAGRVGCHQGGATPAPPTPTDDGACAMRSACGHHDGATVTALQAVLAPATRVRAVVVATRSWTTVSRPHPSDAPAPPDHPPETVRV